MDCSRTLRKVGIASNMFVIIMFVSGLWSSHMIDHQNGHYGLWENCIKLPRTTRKSQTNNSLLVSSASNSFPVLSTRESNKTNKSDDANIIDESSEPKINSSLQLKKSSTLNQLNIFSNKSDSDVTKHLKNVTRLQSFCKDIGFDDIPVFFHITRLLIIGGAIPYLIGVFSRRNIRATVQEHGSWYCKFFGEICSAFGAVIGWFGLRCFRDYHTENSKYPPGKLGVSYFLIQNAIYLTFPAVLLMLTPHLEKHEFCNSLLNYIVHCRGTNVQNNNQVNTTQNSRRGSGNRRNRSSTSRSRQDSLAVENAPTGNVLSNDINFRLSEDSLDDYRLRDGANFYSQYSPETHITLPPSYDDAMRDSTNNSESRRVIVPYSEQPPPPYSSSINSSPPPYSKTE